MPMPEIIRIQTAGGGYDIHLGRGLLDSAGALIAGLARTKKAAVITDTNVAPLYGGHLRQLLEAKGFDAPLYAFPAGERSKNHATLLDIYGFLAASDMTRADLIVALGGGVVGDVAGFAAATFERGLDYVQIPTTLLAQVDSSIGGKTAVDLPEGKNLVGAFWQPRLVICDPDTLRTLDSRNIACGMAEVIKHACIRSRVLFELLQNCSDLDAAMERLIAENLRIKGGIIERDEREKGERMLLNFGHTFGHAIEKLSRYETYTHGEAVAIGMSLIARAGEKAGLTLRGTAEKIGLLLEKFGLPCVSRFTPAQIAAAAANDKKRAGEDIRLVLLRDIGEGFVYSLPVSALARFVSP